MSSSQFQFKQFTITQEKSAMKVGTDGVLLGAWAEAAECGRMLDIGTGTGVIALMLAQRFPTARIDAIDIDPCAAEEAAQNAARSPWAERIGVSATALEDFAPACLYDLIVINPPFYNATLKPSDDARATARHADSLPFKDVTKFADRYLSTNGRLAVIYPTNNEENIMLGVAASSLRLLKVCDIYTKAPSPGSNPAKVGPCKRRMMLLGRPGEKNNCEGKAVSETLFLRNSGGDYSAEYLALTSDFYLYLK